MLKKPQVWCITEDHGSQYVSIVYNDTLAAHGIAASTGSVGDCYDNAMAESVNGSYKLELIYDRTWSDVTEVEVATLYWVNWWNESRLHQHLDYRTPGEVEAEYCNRANNQETMGNKTRV